MDTLQTTEKPWSPLSAEDCFYSPSRRNIIDVVRPDGKGHWGGTLESYRQDYGDDVVLCKLDTATTRMENSYKTPVKEITEKEYTYALEVLPPEKWRSGGGFSSFQMCEYMTGQVSNIYVQGQGRYFGFADVVSLTHEQRVERVQEFIRHPEAALIRHQYRLDNPEMVGTVTEGRRWAIVDFGELLGVNSIPEDLKPGDTYDIPNTTAHGRDTVTVIEYL